MPHASTKLAILAAFAALASCTPVVSGGGSAGSGGHAITATGSGGAGGASVTSGTGGAGGVSVTSSTGGAGGASASSSTSGGCTTGGGDTGAGGSGTIMVLASGLAQPTFVAVAGSSLFVTEAGYGGPGGSLVRVPRNGGAMERVVPHQNSPWAVGVGDGFVYWSNYGSGNDGEIRRFSLCDETVDVLATGLGYPWALAVNDGSVYWTDSNTSRLLAVRPDETLDVLATGQAIPAPIAVDGTGVYYGVQGSSPPSDSPIRRWTSAGTTDLYTGVERSHAIALDDDHLYFGTDDGVIRRGTRDGDPAVVLASGQGQTWGFALADGWLFYTSLFDGFVARVPTSGGAVEVLATGQSYPEGIAVDADAVYWVSQNSGQVMRLAR